MLNPNFVLIGVFAQAVGGFSYLVDTVKGKIQPNRVSWFLWALAPMIAFAAEIKQGVGIQSLTTFIVGFVPLCIFIASFVNKKAEWKLRKLDFICGTLSLLGLILWYVTKVGNIAILFSILADGLAYIPTIVKSYHHPESENIKVYFLGLLNPVIALLTIKIWNFQTYGFPLYIFIADLITTVLIQFKLGKILSKKK